MYDIFFSLYTSLITNLTSPVFHEIDDALTHAPLDINMSQKFYHKRHNFSTVKIFLYLDV